MTVEESSKAELRQVQRGIFWKTKEGKQWVFAKGVILQPLGGVRRAVFLLPHAGRAWARW